jgi:hypothetical protein
MWQPLVIEYLGTKARHDDAKCLMHHAERTFDKLAKRYGDERAYEIAGVGLADERSVRACQQHRRAFDALVGSLRGEPFLVRLRAIGVIRCADLPRTANDR